MPDQNEAIVIGGGLIGCFSGWYLRLRGWNVTILERDRIGSGASNGNCGYICPSHALPLSLPGTIRRSLPSLLKSDQGLSVPLRYDPPLWKWLIAFGRECRWDRTLPAAAARHALLASSMELYRELLTNEAVRCEWQDAGLLLVFRSQQDFARYAATADLLQQEFGILAKPFEAEAVRELEPTLRHGMGGGWHFPGDAHVRPDRLLTDLRDKLEQRNVTIQERVEVTSLRPIESRRSRGVETSLGSLRADLVVLATGAEAPHFARCLGCRIPIQPGKGYSLTLPRLERPPLVPMIFAKDHVAVTPFETGFRIGSTLEFSGYDRSLNLRRLALLRRSAAEHLAEPLPTRGEEAWWGWRPMVHDGNPCIDRVPAAENVILAAGNGMIGLATAPATGKLVAEMASNHEPHLDITPYSLARFG